MKSLLIFLVVLLLFTSCQDDDGMDRCNDELITGTWQFTGYFVSDGSSADGPWTTVENGFLLTLNADGTFTSTDSNDCAGGTYSWQSSGEFTLEYACEPVNSGSGVGGGLFMWEQEDCSLVLRPLGRCIEPCRYLFERI